MKTLTVSRDPRGVARVTMARPESFSALDELMVSELDAAFAELGADDSVRVIVLTGEGKAFSAGADLEWMQRASQTQARPLLSAAARTCAVWPTCCGAWTLARSRRSRA